MNTTENNQWNHAILTIYWRADRHEESHSFAYKRPTEDNPCPEHPVKVGGCLSTAPLSMSGEWGGLFSDIIVKAFDEHSLTIKYGKQKHVITPGHGVKLDEGGMSYTSFELYLSIRQVEDTAIKMTRDEAFLRHFRTRGRIMNLSHDDVSLLKDMAEQGDPFAKYGYARWLYYMNPEKDSMSEADRLLNAAKEQVPDALGGYALLWHYGDVEANVMDIDRSNLLMQQAISQGSIYAAQQWARFRIYGLHCQAEPALVAKEIEQRLNETEDPDPYWHTLLAYAYEELGRRDDAIGQYEKAIDKGDIEDYYSLAYQYYERGNMALYESLMEEGIKKGCASCYTFRSYMADEDFRKLDYSTRMDMHRDISNWLHKGMDKGDGTCAYLLWYHYYYGQLGFYENQYESKRYLKEGVKLGNVASLTTMAILAERGKWSEKLTPTEIAELWLQAARYAPQDEDALKGLSRVSDPAFLLKHKDELEKYWQPLFANLNKEDNEKSDEDNEKDEDDGRWDAYS